MTSSVKYKFKQVTSETSQRCHGYKEFHQLFRQDKEPYEGSLSNSEKKPNFSYLQLPKTTL